METWIEKTLQGVRILASRDQDHVLEQNGVGFNSCDSNFGHFLASQPTLGPRLADMARKMCWKYQGQLGLDLVTAMWPEGKPKTRAEAKAVPQPLPVSQPVKPPQPKTVGISRNRLVVKFAYDPELVTWIKAFPVRQFLRDPNRWELPLDEKVAISIILKGFTADTQLVEWLDREVAKRKLTPAQVVVKETALVSLRDRMIKLGAYPFQGDGVNQLEEWDGRALLADEMGLGKTIQVLLYLREHPELRPAVIVCPASLKLNWLQEATKWLLHTKQDSRVEILTGSPKPGKELYLDDIYILNYDIMAKWMKQLTRLHPVFLALDEAHYIKNGKAQRTKAVLELGRSIPHVVAITGTPVINGRPMECFNALSLVKPSLFPSRWKFGMRYCDPKFNPWSGGTDFAGASNIEELHKILMDTVMIRRLKKDVLTDLPPTQWDVVPLELSKSARSDYNLVYQGVIKTLTGDVKPKAMTALSQIEYLKQAAYRGKLEQVVEWVENFLESDGKLVLFGTHVEALDALEAHFKDICVRVDGSVSLPKRDERVTRFNEDPSCKLFIGNIQAAGVGLNLQKACSNVAFMEFPWTPGELSQAKDRIHRIGQLNPCTAYLLAAVDTIDVAICETLVRKAKINDQLMDGVQPSEAGILDEVLETLGVHL